MEMVMTESGVPDTNKKRSVVMAGKKKGKKKGGNPFAPGGAFNKDKLDKLDKKSKKTGNKKLQAKVKAAKGFMKKH